MKKKKLLALIFLLIPLLFIGGFSAWIISTSHNIAPGFDEDHSLALYFEEDSSGDYTSLGHAPTLKESVKNDANFDSEAFLESLYISYAEINANGSYVNGSTYTTGLPVDAARYSVRIAFSSTDSDDDSLFTTYTINPIEITSLNGEVSISSIFQGDMATFDDSDVSAIGLNNESLSGSCSYTNSEGTTNIEYNGTASTSTNTVSMTFTPLSKNYLPYVFNAEFTMKPVAYISNSYFGSIEVAVSSATTNNKIYVIPDLRNDDDTLHEIKVKSSITIKSGISLILPYSGTKYDVGEDFAATTTFADSSTANVTANRKTLVRLVDGADITVDSGGTLILGGENGTKATYGAYTEINLGSNSSITINGTCECFGYIKEYYDSSNPLLNGNTGVNKGVYDNSFDSERYIYVSSTGTMTTSLSLHDNKGGTTLSTLIDLDICPFNIFDFPNLQTYTRFQYGAKYNAYIRLSRNNVPISKIVNVLRPSSSSDKSIFFQAGEGETCFEYCPKTALITTASDHTIAYVNCDMNVGSLYVDATVLKVDTSTMFIPLSYKFSFYIAKTFNTLSYDVKFMPGAYVKILPTGTINITSDVIFYKGDSLSQFTSTEGVSYSNKTDATCINNGKIVVGSGGKLAAYIQTEDTTGNAVIDFKNISQSSLSVTTAEGTGAVNIPLISSSGPFVNSDNTTTTDQLFKAGVEVKSSTSIAGWTGESLSSYMLTVNVDTSDGYKHNLYSYSIYTSENSDGSNPTTVVEDSTDTSYSYELEAGSYLNIVVNDATSTTINDGEISYNSSTWYYVDSDYNIVVTPSQGYLISYSCGGGSGAGNVRFTIKYGSDPDNLSETYTSDSYKGSLILPQDVYFTITPKSTGLTSFISGWGGSSHSKVTKTTYNTDGTSSTETLLDADNTQWSQSSTATKLDGDYSFALTEWSQESSGGTCLAEGTLITMADGTQRPVEQIQKGDMLIVFNHETGKYEEAKVLFNDSEDISNYTVINLTFSNGSTVRVIDEHGFFDLDTMKYVYIDEYNYNEYIGHRFVSSTYVNGQIIQDVATLDSVIITNEYIKVYSPVTEYHLNYISENMLSMPGGVSGIFNIFEYDETLKYDEELMQKDIEMYGLFTYDDFKHLVDYEVYASFPTQYFKVAIAKGILTWEDLYEYIERYASKV